MKYDSIVDYDYNNGDGIAVTLWVTGCPHRCKGCHNPQLWDKNYGTDFDIEAIDKIMKALSDPDVDKHLSILGGEPLSLDNIEHILQLCNLVKNTFPNKKIWVWTGYKIEDLDNHQKNILDYVDYVIDGKFIEELKVKNEWYGSSNQKIYDINLLFI